ncbi:MAG: threonine synthase [Synergistota bacterium]|nr:threonine synthase [Synergistota bacterium]
MHTGVIVMVKGILQAYGKYLPLTEGTPTLSLCEGGTPLVSVRNLGEELSVELFAKYEGLNPTGSFKDRGMVLAVAKAVEEGAKAVICASTGNTSASAAAYAAAAGIPCFVLLPAGAVALGKLAQAMIYGARVLAVRGNFDRALEMAREGAERAGYAIVNSVNPYRLMGQRSAAWEICDELGEPPDRLVLPVGNAGNISAYCAGFEFYRELGLIERLPKLVGVQAEGAAPLVTGREFDEPETVATAIRIGRPVGAETARRAVEVTQGRFMAVSDDEILDAQRLLASSDGLFAEPASCAPLAGLLKLKRGGELPPGLRVVMVLTGNGLKDPDSARSRANPPQEIDGTFDALAEAIGL